MGVAGRTSLRHASHRPPLITPRSQTGRVVSGRCRGQAEIVGERDPEPGQVGLEIIEPEVACEIGPNLLEGGEAGAVEVDKRSRVHAGTMQRCRLTLAFGKCTDC